MKTQYDHDHAEALLLNNLMKAFPTLFQAIQGNGYHHATVLERSERSPLRMVKRIYHHCDKDNATKRAYTIEIEIIDLRLLPMRYEWALQYKTTLDAGGTEQMTISFGQNQPSFDLFAAEDRFKRVFDGLGKPFYQD